MNSVTLYSTLYNSAGEQSHISTALLTVVFVCKVIMTFVKYLPEQSQKSCRERAKRRSSAEPSEV